ncbi:hypothetical protein, partial [Massilia sp.]|uniref:hypothetical protein n=1 Tax=Massilia sp. TaxID=1882437 RepID=UPI00352C7F1E
QEVSLLLHKPFQFYFIGRLGSRSVEQATFARERRCPALADFALHKLDRAESTLLVFGTWAL